MIRVLSVVGTRPEVIKMAPVIRELQRNRAAIESRVCVTAQHREMLYPLMDLLALPIDRDLQIMQPGQLALIRRVASKKSLA